MHAGTKLLRTWGPREDSDREVYAALARSRAVLYTPHVAATLREFRSDLDHLHTRVNLCIGEHLRTSPNVQYRPGPDYVELVVIDEAERLTDTAIEQQPHHFARRRASNRSVPYSRDYDVSYLNGVQVRLRRDGRMELVGRT